MAAALAFVPGAVLSQTGRPLLDHLKAMTLAFEALNSKFGRDDYGAGGADFDETRREWRVEIDRGEGKAPRRLVVSISEISGAICAHAPAQDGCVASGDASALLEAERGRRKALAEAARNPPPDLQGAMAALIRYQAKPGGFLSGGNLASIYVSMHWPDARESLDLSSDAIRSLRDLRIRILPGSQWIPPAGNKHVGENASVNIGLPARRADGTFEVRYGYWCGSLCAATCVAVMRHDAAGWHVVSSEVESMS
ncbi:hypothetical protein FCE95_04315 [Luteimonas gilva]|uniref:Uncharacterized protein n=1 Tax=Luteimonas gilva TaxID=2572684 RepID=A0A4U5JZ27_9GAMM|nr:hypothetical protein [Luteimonas gilva]TKR33527.1 hypothetical protein FCE95_04315 [Luteimonas gilva]